MVLGLFRPCNTKYFPYLSGSLTLGAVCGHHGSDAGKLDARKSNVPGMAAKAFNANDYANHALSRTLPVTCITRTFLQSALRSCAVSGEG
jgi:hypothetical protein